MMYDWLQLIGCIKRTDCEYVLFGRYKFNLQEEELIITDSFDNFKLLGSENIKEFEHFLDFVTECISKAEKWN